MKNWNQIEQQLLLRLRQSDETSNNVFSLDKTLPTEELQERFVQNLLTGNYLDIIHYFNGTILEHKSLVESILTEENLFLAFKSYLLCHLEDDGGEEEKGRTLAWRIFEVFILGITYLELYCQCNYTGPELLRQHRMELDCMKEEETKAALFQLECDGNFAHHTVDMPHLLLFSRILLSLLSHPSRASWKNGITLSENGVIIPPSLQLHDQFREELVNSVGSFSSLAVWNARACVLHVRLLLNASYDVLPTLWNETNISFTETLRDYGGSDPSYDLLKGEPRLREGLSTSWTISESIVGAKVWLEWGLACHHFSYGDKGKKKFLLAQSIVKLEIYLTAALGKRTKYQRENIAQLLLYAKSHLQDHLSAPVVTTANCNGTTDYTDEQVAVQEGENPNEFEIGKHVIQETTKGEEVVVREVLLDQVNTGVAENIILEGGPMFENPDKADSGGSLHPLDQIIILALCLDVSNSNPVDGLTNEEMQPYIERVLNQPINWMIHSTGLLERSWIEFERRKTADRAMLQIQALIDQHSTKLTLTQASYQSIEESAKVSERMDYLYEIIYPSQFELKKDLAKKYLQCQVFLSALNYFKELQMWDEVVACYQLMNKPSKAEMIVREQLKNGETPYMITALADITGNEQLYEQAWNLSQGRYPRAKRTLGKICFDRNDYSAAIQHLNQALAVQPLVHTAWYLKGIACMRLELWEEGIQSFVRCVQLEPELAEAWTNLGAIYMRQKEYQKAYHSLMEARKHKSDDYRVLENMLTTTLALEKWKESIQQMNHLIDLRFKSQQPIHYQELKFLGKILPQLLYQHQIKKDHLFDEGEDVSDAILHPPTPPALNKDEVDENVTANRHLKVEEEALIEKRKSKIQAEYDLQMIRYQHLIEDFEKLLNKIVTTLRSDPVVNEIISEFHNALGNYRVAFEYRVKQIRAIINESGWEKKEEKVRMLASASQKLKESLEKPDMKKEDYFSSKMLIQSCIRKLDKNESFTREIEEKMKEIVTQLEK